MSEFDFTEDEPTEAAPTEIPEEYEFVVQKARKKPMVIEFALVMPGRMRDAVDWIHGHGGAATLGNDQLIIQTLEGPFTVRTGDVIIRGTAGEFYRHDPGLFKENYEVLG